MTRLDPALGSNKRDLNDWNPIVVIRHGFNSSDKPFVGLAAHIGAQIPHAVLDNHSYEWRESVLVNGARLAKHILTSYPVEQPLILIGHSMGGLVCRVANVILRDGSFAFQVGSVGRSLGYPLIEILDIQNFRFDLTPRRRVDALITLATPNSGAVLHGQVSRMSSWGLAAANTFPPTRISSVADLTTDRLFRLLQVFTTDTRTLSVSGSKYNRFSRAVGWAVRVGIQLDLPHDGIVEDRSVDLRSAILPNEIVYNSSAPYMHARAYLNCTDVTHTNIYDSPVVRKYILKCIERF